jgi:hypothetical protein
MLSKNRFHQIKSFAVKESASNSALVDDVVTVVPLTALWYITPPKERNRICKSCYRSKHRP